MGNPNQNCPFILQIIMLWLLQRLHRRELFDWAFVSLQIFANADILLLLQTVRAACVIIGWQLVVRVGACLVRGQISFIGLNTLVRIFAIFIIPFFCGESKQDHTKNKPHPVQSNQHRVWLVYYYFFIAFKIE